MLGNFSNPTIGTKQLRVALGHKARVGKDTFADEVRKWGSEHGLVVQVIAFSDELYQLAALVQGFAGAERKKDAALLQLLGMMMREHYSADFWINKLIPNINPYADIVVVTDMRLKNEFAAMKTNGFLTFDILRDDRPIDRDPNHISEIDLDDVEFDFVITNNGTEKEFRASVRDNISIVSSLKLALFGREYEL